MRKKEKLLDGNIYSLDMLRINFRIDVDDVQRYLDSLKYDLRFNYWSSYSVSTYRHNFTVECENGHTFWIGFCVNSEKASVKYKTCTIEFNPCKVGTELTFISHYNKLFGLSHTSPVVKRFDLAIDIPVDRDKCFLIKDKRTYEEHSNSSLDKTQYLGPRNSPGRVKLYNKAKELGISDYGLTRFELTIDYEYSYFEIVQALMPTVYIFDDYQFNFNITGTDKVLLIACLNDMNLLNELGRTKREKIREIIGSDSLILKLNKHQYDSILAQVEEYLNPIV